MGRLQTRWGGLMGTFDKMAETIHRQLKVVRGQAWTLAAEAWTLAAEAGPDPCLGQPEWKGRGLASGSYTECTHSGQLSCLGLRFLSFKRGDGYYKT